MSVKKIRAILRRALAERGRIDVEAADELVALLRGARRVSAADREALRRLLTQADGGLDPEARHSLERFLMIEACRPSALKRRAEILTGVQGNFALVAEGLVGTVRSWFRTGAASAERIKEVRERPSLARWVAGLGKLAPDADAAGVEQAMREAIRAIDGFSFLAAPPAQPARLIPERGQGPIRGTNHHVVLIKPGVNWGRFGYPTVTSWESVYALIRLTFAEADARDATAEIIVGEESGIENKWWCGSTMGNLEHVGVVHAAVLAGLERAAHWEARGHRAFTGAQALLAQARQRSKVRLQDREWITMAARAGVQVIAFEEGEHTRIPVPRARHFQKGIMVSRLVAQEVTDMINLPKPPGRHMIMGNTGLTGAVKNHVGLLGAADRAPALHGGGDWSSVRYDGENGDLFLDRFHARLKAIEAGRFGEVARGVARTLGQSLAQAARLDWKGHGPGPEFQEKLVELYLAFEDKQRFTVTDMRRTIGSFGPDFGHTVNVGSVIAARDPATVDLLASAFLKCAYDDTRLGAGRTWLRTGNAFDLALHVAANSYGVGPVDLAHLDITNEADSGFSGTELGRLKRYLGG